MFLEEQSHTDITSSRAIQNNSYLNYLTILHWLVTNLIGSRTTNTYQHYQEILLKKISLRALHDNITLARNISQSLSNNKYMPKLPGQQIHKTIITYIF